MVTVGGGYDHITVSLQLEQVEVVYDEVIMFRIITLFLVF